MKLGKLPHTADARDLRFATYLDKAALPQPPASFGHGAVVKTWGMLGNDSVGDCVWAGAGHETMLATRMSKTHADASFTDKGVLSDYSAVTGFDPDDPSTDQGTDMRAAANYRRKTGVVDSKGHRHKVAAYVELSPGNLSELDLAIYLFGFAGIGIEFPASAMDQFNAGKPWDVVAHSPIEGGHYIPGVTKRADGMYEVVTWGKVQRVTARFLSHYMDEGIAYLSTEVLAYGDSLEGFSLAQLRTDLAALA